MYLLSVPSVSSSYFSKIKRTSYVGKLPALSQKFFIVLINVEMLTIVGILTFISMIKLYVQLKRAIYKLI